MLSRTSRAGLLLGRQIRPNSSGIPRAILSSTQCSSIHLPAIRPSISSPLASQSSLVSSRAMSSGHGGESTLRPEPDQVLQDIADYIHNYNIDSELAFETARLCLIDTIGCGLEGLRFPECTKLLGPVVEGTIVPNGVLAALSFLPVLNIRP